MGAYGSPDLSNQESKPVKKRKPFYKRWWFIVLVIIIVIGVISSGGEKDTPKKVEKESTQTTSNIVEETSQEDEKDFFYVGDVVETEKVRATITGIEKSVGSDFNKPEEGHEYVFVNMTIENISDKEMTISSVFSFDAYVNDVAINEDLLAQTEAGKTMNGTIAPGKKLVGKLAYELPKDWEQLEIHFEPDVWDDVKIKWIINNE